MHLRHDDSDAERLFLSALPVVDEIVHFIGQRRRCRDDEAEDFASFVRLKLIEHEYSILREFCGRASLKTYLSVVIHHLFLDFRRQRWGVWRPCAEARRLGPTAVLLDVLLHREGLPLEQAIEMLRANHGVDASCAELRDLAARFPVRQLRRTEGEAVLAEIGVSAEDVVIGPALAEERHRRARALRQALRRATASLSPDDALALRLQFQETLTVARIAELLDVPAKPLYRRLEKLRAELRRSLESLGFDSTELPDLLGDPAFDEPEDKGDGTDDPGSSKSRDDGPHAPPGGTWEEGL
jgi:RNA polymerase sigma factor for flagellar operon FliA